MQLSFGTHLGEDFDGLDYQKTFEVFKNLEDFRKYPKQNSPGGIPWAVFYWESI